MTKVQFVCIGNCCRSQMAEGFANHYGQDVLLANSSGLSPTQIVAAETVLTMAAFKIDISSHYPKRFEPYEAQNSDLIVNMSGYSLPGRLAVPVEDWEVEDPYGDTLEVYRRVAGDIEMRVMQLILKLRRLANN